MYLIGLFSVDGKGGGLVWTDATTRFLRKPSSKPEHPTLVEGWTSMPEPRCGSGD